jgi:tRNA threonylcarbamoyl adenosine modification protein YeaZ
MGGGMEGPVLVVETSGRCGQIGLARNGVWLEQCQLDGDRRHARDLSSAIRELLRRHGVEPRGVQGVIVARGPGSFTGLRVGLATAMTLAYAAGARIVGIGSFSGLAEQANVPEGRVAVVGDALRGCSYHQTFVRSADGWDAETDLVVVDAVDANCPEQASVVQPNLDGLLAQGMRRLKRGEHDAPEALEPLYVQPSSAERQWRDLGRF